MLRIYLKYLIAFLVLQKKKKKKNKINIIHYNIIIKSFIKYCVISLINNIWEKDLQFHFSNDIPYFFFFEFFLNKNLYYLVL